MEIRVNLGEVYLGNKKVCLNVNDKHGQRKNRKTETETKVGNGNQSWQRKLQLTSCFGFKIILKFKKFKKQTTRPFRFSDWLRAKFLVSPPGNEREFFY